MLTAPWQRRCGCSARWDHGERGRGPDGYTPADQMSPRSGSESSRSTSPARSGVRAPWPRSCSDAGSNVAWSPGWWDRWRGRLTRRPSTCRRPHPSARHHVRRPRRHGQRDLPGDPDPPPSQLRPDPCADAPPMTGGGRERGCHPRRHASGSAGYPAEVAAAAVYPRARGRSTSPARRSTTEAGPRPDSTRSNRWPSGDYFGHTPAGRA
jgi:hypothetical protein